MKPPETEAHDIQDVMYLGTNEKDTNEPVFTLDEAKARAEEILGEHFGGCTIQEANGGWADEGTLFQEYTLVIYLSDTTMDQVHAAAYDLLRIFHLRECAVQKRLWAV
jgi:hypothetical protein